MNYSRFRTIAAVLVVGVGLGACSGASMRPVSEPKVLTQKDPSKAVIVFYRPLSFRGSAIFSPVFDITDGHPAILGLLITGQKLAYPVPPGKRRFMVVSETADFVDAEVLAGKTYYVMVQTRIGHRRARFSLLPVSALSAEPKDGLGQSEWVENTPETIAWSNKVMETTKRRQNLYLPGWLKSRYREELKPGDGE